MAEHTSQDGRNELNGSPLDALKPDDSTCTEDTEDQNLWTRPLARKWIPMLFVGSCLLYCARMAMPICAVTMAAAFHWTKIDSGLVLGGFFWGYCLTQILGGHASDKMGGERVLLMSAVLWALITAATPLLAHLGSHTVFFMSTARFLMGLFQGVFFPSLASLCSQRVVEGERGFLMSTMHSGTLLGTLLAGGLGSLLLDRFGWESVFYCIGAMTGVWALLVWQCLIKDERTPKRIESSNDSLWKMPRTQWLTLFKKPPVWAMVFAHMCISSTCYTLLSWLPTYFKETFPNGTGWIYNVVPWLTAIPSALCGGYVSDFLISQGYSVGYVRKFMQSVAMGVSSLFIMLLSSTASFHSAVIFISVAVGATTFSSGGVSVNVQDLAPSCAGALFGFMNMMGALMGVVMVSLSGYLIEVTLTWAMVFSLITLVNTTGLCIYLLFGDAHRVDLEVYSPVRVI
ncbi:solute carrier family 17 member 9-like [Sphaeramia orbicularis]|uniref:Voltage-gated purine nucleotide uniporter SLC17A9 n=1 Tax=Sphaeramia orbicularis TaxID=375764 RepID=A0A672ZG97_9TELE|nr:solute carrier family 17 member 9-like [Sphaeramia orbicularis]